MFPPRYMTEGRLGSNWTGVNQLYRLELVGPKLEMLFPPSRE